MVEHLLAKERVESSNLFIRLQDPYLHFCGYLITLKIIFILDLCFILGVFNVLIPYMFVIGSNFCNRSTVVCESLML